MPLLNLLINCIPAKSAPKILSLKDEHTFRFSNFLVIGLCNPSGKSEGRRLCILLLLTVPFQVLEPVDFLSNNL